MPMYLKDYQSIFRGVFSTLSNIIAKRLCIFGNVKKKKKERKKPKTRKNARKKTKTEKR